MKRVIAFLLLLLAGRMYAQEIAGRILDEKREPFSGVIVQVYQSGILKGSTTTNVDGEYKFVLESGYFDLLTLHSGYDSMFTHGVIVDAGLRTTVNCVMLPFKNGQAGKVVRTYKRPLNPHGQTIVPGYSTAPAVSSEQDADTVTMLLERIQKLEERVTRLEHRPASSPQTPEGKKMMKIAREHMATEQKNFNPEDIKKAESLYNRASQILWDDASKPLLDSVVSMYPQLNRAGCAQLYRAQHELGNEKERLLKDCIQRFSNCYYGDGAQVGPLAMLQLADYYQASGKERDARQLYKRIRNESPDAVGHDGGLLVDKIE